MRAHERKRSNEIYPSNGNGSLILATNETKTVCHLMANMYSDASSFFLSRCCWRCGSFLFPFAMSYISGTSIFIIMIFRSFQPRLILSFQFYAARLFRFAVNFVFIVRSHGFFYCDFQWYRWNCRASFPVKCKNEIVFYFLLHFVLFHSLGNCCCCCCWCDC